MGGKSKPSNNQMVEFQMQQAAEARAKEEQRKARLEKGQTAIDDLFGDKSFGNEFYDKYTNANLNYALPQLGDQYEKAKKNLTFDLARAGTLRSTMAGEAQGDIESQKAVNEAGIRAKADSDTGALRTNIGQQKQTAIGQLYSTEDPDVAANTALHMVQNAQLQQPNLTPLGELFKPLIIGAMGGFSGYNDQQNFNRGMQPRSPTGGGSGSTYQ